MYVGKTLLSLCITLCLARITASASGSTPVRTNSMPQIVDSITRLRQKPAKSMKEARDYAEVQKRMYASSPEYMEPLAESSTAQAADRNKKRHNDRIKESFSEAELLAEFVQLDRLKKLALVYVVNTTIGNKYDILFNELANSYTKTTFFIVDTSNFSTTGQFKVGDGFTKPFIYLRKYGFTKDAFQLPDEAKLKNIIGLREVINRTKFINAGAQMTLSDKSSQWNKAIDVAREYDYGGHFGNGLQRATSNGELSKTFAVAKQYGDIPCVMYIVKTGTAHDPMVEKLASKFIDTFFIKITSNTYRYSTGVNPYSGLPEPSFKVYRFGQLTQHFSFAKKEELENKIAYYIGMDCQIPDQLLS